MESLARLVIYALAAFRVAEALVVDDGPFDLFLELRGWFNRAPHDSKGLRRMIANGLACVHCTGVWISFVSALFFCSSNGVMEFILSFLAIAGLQSILAGNVGRTAR